MSKVIMGNGGFYGCLSEPHGVSPCGKETAQTHVFVFSPFLLLNRLERQSTLITHNANRHCRVRFYTFLGHFLSKQLYDRPNDHMECQSSIHWFHERQVRVLIP